ncbi:MAG: amidohydrolase family protein [Bacteroidota bacterium]
MEEQAKNRILKQLDYLEKNKDKLTMDADTHPSMIEELSEQVLQPYKETPNYYHGRPASPKEQLNEMKLADVDSCLVWQNPATTVYSDDESYNYKALLAANSFIKQISEEHPDKFIPAGWTDPQALGVDRAIQLAEKLVLEYGFCIVKMNPAQNKFPMDSDQVIQITDKIIQMGAIPAFHFGADTPYTPAEALENIARGYKDSPILAAHMGGGGASYEGADEQYIKSRELGLRCPNIKFIMSAKRDTHIESDLITYQQAGEPFCNNLFCGSDFPYGKMTWNFGGFRWLFEGLKKGKNHPDPRIRNNPELFNDQVIQNFMGRNFAEFIIGGYKHLLKEQG